MTAEIIAHRPTDRYCEKHGTMLIEYLFRSDKLKNDWVLSICKDCHDEASNGERDEEES